MTREGSSQRGWVIALIPKHDSGSNLDTIPEGVRYYCGERLQGEKLTYETSDTRARVFTDKVQVETKAEALRLVKSSYIVKVLPNN